MLNIEILREKKNELLKNLSLYFFNILLMINNIYEN